MVSRIGGGGGEESVGGRHTRTFCFDSSAGVGDVFDQVKESLVDPTWKTAYNSAAWHRQTCLSS